MKGILVVVLAGLAFAGHFYYQRLQVTQAERALVDLFCATDFPKELHAYQTSGGRPKNVAYKTDEQIRKEQDELLVKLEKPILDKVHGDKYLHLLGETDKSQDATFVKEILTQTLLICPEKAREPELVNAATLYALNILHRVTHD